MANAATDLGAQMCNTRMLRTSTQWARHKTAAATLRRVSQLPLSSERKALYVKASALPQALFGCEVAVYSVDWMGKLRAAIVKALWNDAKARHRSPWAAMQLLGTGNCDPEMITLFRRFAYLAQTS